MMNEGDGVSIIRKSNYLTLTKLNSSKKLRDNKAKKEFFGLLTQCINKRNSADNLSFNGYESKQYIDFEQDNSNVKHPILQFFKKRHVSNPNIATFANDEDI